MSAVNGCKYLIHSGERGLGELDSMLFVLFASVFTDVKVISLVQVTILVVPFLYDLNVGISYSLVIDTQELLKGHLTSLATVKVLEKRTHLLL